VPCVLQSWITLNVNEYNALVFAGREETCALQVGNDVHDKALVVHHLLREVILASSVVHRVHLVREID